MPEQIISLEEDKNYSRSFIEKYLKYKFLYIAAFVLLTALAILYIWASDPVYNIQATLMIKDDSKAKSLSLNVSDLDFMVDQKSVDNEVEILKSETVIKEVANQLNLNIASYKKEEGAIFYRPVFMDAPLRLVVESMGKEPIDPLKIQLLNNNSFRLFNNDSVYRFAQNIQLDGLRFSISKTSYYNNSTAKFKFIISSMEETIESLRNNLNVNVPSKTASVLEVNILYPSKEMGSYVLSRIISEYNKLNIAEQRSETDTIVNLIKNRLALLGGQLHTYENTEEDYKVKNGITNLSEDAKLFLEKVKDNDKLIYEANIQLEIINAVKHYLNNSSSANTAPPNVTGITDPVIVEMVGKLNELQLSKKQLSLTATENNPVLINTDEKINQVKQSIVQNLNIQQSGIESALGTLQKEKKVFGDKITAVPANEKMLVEIIREKNVREVIYTFLLQKIEEASLNNADALSKLRVIDQPYSNIKPVKPNKLILFSTVLFLTILLPSIYISLANTLNKTITSKLYVEKKLPYPIIGEITRMRKFRYLVFKEGNRFAIDQFRRMRTKLQKLFVTEEPKTILVTSSTSGEGKTFVSANLATCFALAGHRTVIIDFDLRKPDVASSLSAETHGGHTLNGFLAGDLTGLDKLAHQHPLWKNLYVVTTEKSEERFTELPLKKMEELFNYLKQNFTCIVLNTTPFMVISDALILERFADFSLFIVRHEYTSNKYLDYIKNSIDKGEFKNPLIVYNDIPATELYEKDIFKGEYFKD